MVQTLSFGRNRITGYDDRRKDCRHGQRSTGKGAGKVWGMSSNCTGYHGQGCNPSRPSVTVAQHA